MLLQAWCNISEPSVNSNWSYSRKRAILAKISNILSHVTLKFGRWPWKTMGHIFHTISSFVHDFLAICEFKLEWQSGNFFWPLWPWPRTSEPDILHDRNIVKKMWQTERETDTTIHRAAWLQLKTSAGFACTLGEKKNSTVVIALCEVVRSVVQLILPEYT